ncbi:MAG: hypothetical protein ABI967_11595 [bacterium]
MKLLFTVAPKMAFFDCAGMRLRPSLPDKSEFDHASSIIYFNVDDIQSAIKPWQSGEFILKSN